MDELAVRQQAVLERRHWVRLTRACNNRCLFCLDSGAQNGTVVPEDVVKARILEGRQSGATRLILSGGEPTIHPRFLDFVAFGTKVGYTWIQVITNGRMFRYKAFAEKAVQSGLREATFSMHGHTAELHDRLVGHKGAFVQALTGLHRLKNLGVVVSVDVVLTRLNLPYLREILDFYMRQGVYEFDLLHLVPFGRGFEENRDMLFPDPDMLHKELERALELADRPGVFLWTNRLPIQYLEGHERLFQDPHKLFDEVLGEREAFRELFATGKEPECLGDRCPHCFLRPFCRAARSYVRQKWDRNPLTRQIEEAPELTKALAHDILSGKGPAPPVVKMPLREKLSDAMEAAPDLDAVAAVRERFGTKVYLLPYCLGGEPGPAMPAPGRWPMELAEFVTYFIERLYAVKSLRCRSCRFDSVCPGIHVNLARVYGLSVLEPVLEN